MKENLEKAIRKAANETEKAQALMTVLENEVLFNNPLNVVEQKRKIAKALYAIWDSIEEIESHLEIAAVILGEEDVL